VLEVDLCCRFSLLRTSTCAYIIITALIIWVWMSKPQSIKYQTILLEPWATGAVAMPFVKIVISRLENGTECTEIMYYLLDLIGNIRPTIESQPMLDR